MLKKSRFRIASRPNSCDDPFDRNTVQHVAGCYSRSIVRTRFLIPAIPLLLLPTGSVIERSLVTKKFAYVLYGIGAVLNGSAALVSVIHPNFPSIPSWTTQIFTSMLSSVATGSLDVWWLSQLGQLWWVLTLSIIACPVASLIVINHFIPDSNEKESESIFPVPVPVPVIERELTNLHSSDYSTS